MYICNLESIGSLTEYKEELTYSPAEIRSAVECKIRLLWAKGLRPGDKVILNHGNSFLFFVDLFTIWKLGCSAIPLSPLITEFEINNIIEYSGAKILLTRDYRKSYRNIAVVDTAAKFDAPAVNEKIKIEPTSNALILYTSGTAGIPRGVLHTYRSIENKLKSLRLHLPVQDISNTLCLLPTSFGHGLICNCLYPLVNGSHLVIAPPFDLSITSNLGEIIDLEEITFMSSVPSIWQIATATSPSPAKESLRRIHCASAPLSLELWKKIKMWAPTAILKNVYGTTETAGWVAGTSDNEAHYTDGLVGKPWGATFKISEATEGIGEILIQTDSLMKGYYNQDLLTKSVMDNGWFKTGDMGHIDSLGQLVIVGRKASIINKAGVKIYPEEIDNVLLRRKDLIDVCTFGIPHNIAGEKVGAAVVFASDANQKNLESIADWCQTYIPKYKIPSVWFELEKIPRNSRGKIDRNETAKICLKKKNYL